MRTVLPLIISSILLGVSMFFLTSQDGDFKTKISYSENSFMEDIVIEQKKTGNLIWRLEAKKAIHLNEDDIKLENITVLLPEKDLKLKAQKAFYSLKTKDFHIPEDIDVSAKEFDIKGKGIYWDSKTNTLKSESDIKILGKGFSIEGNSLSATSDKARLENNVKAVFYGN
ncbi:MAG: LPS export ABC transporter periplasmic protein LptC [Thermodesulfovibrionales bacterium]|nr:LPS export ABC transporter periplasmic protein LptC [Thermodesulfovibrionales bacterium]